MTCPECGNEMVQIDTTYSNINTSRTTVGQHTCDIYHCDYCEESYLDNFLSGQIEAWHA